MIGQFLKWVWGMLRGNFGYSFFLPRHSQCVHEGGATPLMPRDA